MSGIENIRAGISQLNPSRKADDDGLPPKKSAEQLLHDIDTAIDESNLRLERLTRQRSELVGE